MCYLRKSRCPSLPILLKASAFSCLPKESFAISILVCAMELTRLSNLQHLEMFSGLAFRLPYFRHSNTTFFLIINFSISVWHSFVCHSFASLQYLQQNPRYYSGDYYIHIKNLLSAILHNLCSALANIRIRTSQLPPIPSAHVVLDSCVF